MNVPVEHAPPVALSTFPVPAPPAVRPVSRRIGSLEEEWREQAWDALLQGEDYPPRSLVIEADHGARRPTKPHWAVARLVWMTLALTVFYAAAAAASWRATLST